MKRGLALDLGGLTGWGADDPRGGLIPIGSIWDCGHAPGAGYGVSYVRLEDCLLDALDTLQPDYCAYEAPILQHSGSAAAELAFGRGAVVELTCQRLSIPCHRVHIQTARRYFTGNGRAGKSDIWARCRDLGWPASDLNLCDALCVLAYARQQWGGAELILGKTLIRKEGKR